jgi:hypothetical protein
MAAASAAVDFTAVAAFMAAASAAVDFTAVAAFAVAASAAAAFAVAGFPAVDFMEIGFIMETSTIGFSSLTTLETRSLTIPIHITGIIPTATIRMAMVMVIIPTAMDTVVFVAAVFETLISTVMAFMAVVDFTAVVFTAVALMAVSLTAMAPAAVDDPYNEPIYRGNAWYTEADFCY